MSVPASSVRQHEPDRHDHIVGVYDRDDELISAIATYFADALDQNGAVVAIATAAHRVALDAALASKGFAPDALQRAGRYRTLDAADTLATFMHDGTPDPRQFASVVGALVDEAERVGGPVRLFGEMVALLWDEGNVAGAIELESRWNDLAAHHCFALFCAYAMSSLEASGDLAAAKRMCDRHSSVVPLQESPGGDADLAGGAGCDTYDRLFVATPTALHGVRGFVRDALRAWDANELDDEAELIASELATNAVRHARSPFRVSISRDVSSIRIAVRDASFDPPEHVMRDANRDGGRGVRLVVALSRAWGIEAEDDGKTVWAEVSRPQTR